MNDFDVICMKYSNLVYSICWSLDFVGRRGRKSLLLTYVGGCTEQ